jgi:hypothetical protein
MKAKVALPKKKGVTERVKQNTSHPRSSALLGATTIAAVAIGIPVNAVAMGIRNIHRAKSMARISVPAGIGHSTQATSPEVKKLPAIGSPKRQAIRNLAPGEWPAFAGESIVFASQKVYQTNGTWTRWM